ncbi:MAG: hypothetical protein ACRECE_04505, partial [Xanthobacteraceae bacterium]
SPRLLKSKSATRTPGGWIIIEGSSLPDLIRQSMLRSRLRPVGMDAPVKPAHDKCRKSMIVALHD